MPYYVGALFDATSEAALRALRMRLAEADLADAAAMTARPHLTFAICETLDAEAIRPTLRVLCYETPPLPLSLASVGTFPTQEGVVFLAPVVTEPLLAVHARVHRLLDEAGFPSMPYYRPQNWIPHCTVAIGLDAAQVGAAVTLSREEDVFHTDQLIQIVVAEFPPTREIYTLPLRGEIAPSELTG